ncbi:peptidase S8/S53 domain-containing protein [Schizothecium vesticola]|uniref:Peptidase S8/S53 domain-containing protein n=1 Tax=Schizothecium vesticola TaxID=314040 RepID=A0AA40ELG1_9PEZI|nr:peptidase S8/S53 domain-containing protein [Schizothecium vesticola]
MAPHTASKLTALVLGLLCALPSGAFSVPRQTDVELTPPPVIAIKLSPASFPNRKRQDASLAGAKLVESLVLQALPTPNLGRRDGTLKTLPLYNNLPSSTIDKIIQDAEANDPTYRAPNFHAWFQVSLPDAATDFFVNLPHGTAVLGILFAVSDNGLGGIGVAPAARGAVVSVLRGDVPRDNNPAGIMDAAGRMSAGDVMLLEMQVSNAAEDEYWPAELYDAEFDAIRLATAKGIVVIEPAGNGVKGLDADGNPREGTAGVDLDGPVVRPGETEAREYLRRGSEWFRESGAIMQLWGRVDVHAWGENVTTTGCVADFNGCEDAYVQFGGTSAAAPIVAGAALSVQGMLSAKGKRKLNSVEMGELLKIGGTKVAEGAGNIGVMPDLKALIDGGHV